MAINHEEPDHVPLSFKWIMRTFFKDRAWRDQFERADWELKLGLDPILDPGYSPAWRIRPNFKIKMWREIVPAENYSLLVKEYHTEGGVLRQVVHQTPDWPHGDYVPLWSDYMIPRSRSIRYLITNMEDVKAFSQLFNEPTEKEYENFLEEAEHVKRFAVERGLLIENKTLRVGDALAYFMGIENMLLTSFRNPSLIHALLDILLEWNIKYLRQILDAGIVDMINYEGWSESFFTPETYKTFIYPRVKKLVELAHKSRVKFCYGPRTPSDTLFRYFKEMGVDIFWGPDPVQGNRDLVRLKQEFGDRICFWGGVNSYVTLGTGTMREIERATAEAIRILGPGGGFILSAIDSLDEHTPWRNIEQMIRVWRKVGKYLLI